MQQDFDSIHKEIEEIKEKIALLKSRRRELQWQALGTEASISKAIASKKASAAAAMLDEGTWASLNEIEDPLVIKFRELEKKRWW